MSKLKACPFCGKEVILNKGLIAGSDGVYFHDVDCPRGCMRWALTPPEWNTRPLEDALQARVEELEAENARLKAEIVRTQNKDCFTCKYLDSYNMKCTIPVATCVNYALWKGKF